MKKLSLLLIVVTLTIAVVGVAFAFRPAQAQAAPAGDTQAQAVTIEDRPASQPLLVTATPDPEDAFVPGTQETSMVELWDQFCVRKIPYTLLAIPENATFEVVAPFGPPPTFEPGATNPNQYACSSVLILGGQQVVVCTGPNSYSFTLQVTDGGATEEFQVPLKACPIKKDSPD